MVICLERGADLHMAHLMPLPLTVSCFSKIQIGFTFLVPTHRGSPGQRAVKRVYVSCGYITFEQITDKEYGFLSVAQPETRNFANFQHLFRSHVYQKHGSSVSAWMTALRLVYMVLVPCPRLCTGENCGGIAWFRGDVSIMWSMSRGRAHQ